MQVGMTGRGVRGSGQLSFMPAMVQEMQWGVAVGNVDR